MRNWLVLGIAVVGAAASAQAAVTVTAEAAGVQATSAYPAAQTYIEDFSSRGPGTANATGTPDLGDFSSTFGHDAPVVAFFSGFQLGLPSSYGGSGALYGGAYGSSQYGVVHGDATITLSKGVRYFGLWAAALDGGNTVELFNGAARLGSYNLVSTIGSLGAAYYGNPNNGGDSGEPFAFVNFASAEPITSIQFHEGGGGGFEFDNVTLAGAVPEPASWAFMLCGFGLIGRSMRRRTISLAA